MTLEEKKAYSKEYYQRHKDYWRTYNRRNPELRRSNLNRLKKSYGHNNKVKGILMKGGKCSICGIEYDGANGSIFDFHHEDPNEKDTNIAPLLRSKELSEELIKELNKCILVCSNCHRKIHSESY